MSDEPTLADQLRQDCERYDWRYGIDHPDGYCDKARCRAATRIAELEARVKQAVTELDGEHRPQWVKDVGYTEEPVEGREPVGCVMCYPHDSDWPCTSRMIADELKGETPDA